MPGWQMQHNPPIVESVTNPLTPGIKTPTQLLSERNNPILNQILHAAPLVPAEATWMGYDEEHCLVFVVLGFVVQLIIINLVLLEGANEQVCCLLP